MRVDIQCRILGKTMRDGRTLPSIGWTHLVAAACNDQAPQGEVRGAKITVQFGRRAEIAQPATVGIRMKMIEQVEQVQNRPTRLSQRSTLPRKRSDSGRK